VLLAGGVAERADVERALAAGAAGVVAGTRFVVSEESGAHPEYKRRLAGATQTCLTDLFGLGWPDAPHRVVPNAAVLRWRVTPSRLKRVARVLSAAASRLPEGAQGALAATQRASVPLLSPLPPTTSGPAGLLDTGPLYAGESVARIGEVLSAAECVRALEP
jgi:NAD(P)H-dependent flavin oxidoreductase YrpB (nitropropane dioxygenase family)